VISLVSKGASLGAKDSKSRSTLHLAASRGRKDILEYLWSKAVDLEEEDKDGRTALHLAAVNGHTSSVELLLQKGSYIDATDGSASTSLHMSASRGFLETVGLLVSKGASTNLPNDLSMTACSMAILTRNFECFKFLIQYPHHVRGSYTPLHVGCMCDATVVNFLVENTSKQSLDDMLNDSDNPTGSTPLHCAFHSGNLQIATEIVKLWKSDLNCKDASGKYPFQCIPVQCDKRSEMLNLIEHWDGNITEKTSNQKLSPERAFAELSSTLKRSKVLSWARLGTENPCLPAAIKEFKNEELILPLIAKLRRSIHDLKVHEVYAHVHQDKEFQCDMQKSDVYTIVEMLRKDSSNYDHYVDNPKVGHVLKTLQRVHGELKNLGESKLVLDLALVQNVTSATSEDSIKRSNLEGKINEYCSEIEMLCSGYRLDSSVPIPENTDYVSNAFSWKFHLILVPIVLGLLNLIVGYLLRVIQVICLFRIM
jgi:ankyrin repeat protein